MSRINVIEAVEHLARSSFVEILESEEDGQDFVHVPLGGIYIWKK